MVALLAPPAEATRPKLLVIDDDPLFRTLCSGALRDTYETDVAADGHTGVKLAIEQQPGVIILDLLMPVWDGRKALRAIRAAASLEATAVLVLTSDRDTDADELVAEGADAVLSKLNFSRDRLVDAVRTLQPATGNRVRREAKRVVPVMG